MATRRLADLEPIHQPGMNPSVGGKLRQMTDEELLRTATHPRNGQKIKCRPGGNRVFDGNTRVIEMQRRMKDPQSKFKPDTALPVDEDF